MNNKNYQVEKLCGFYVSDWHLTTTILPYINSKIDEKTKVITILENNIEENIFKVYDLNKDKKGF